MRHLRHHLGFYTALAVALAVYLLVPLSRSLRLIAAGDAFFLTYLIWIGVAVRDATPERIRKRAAQADEGLPLIVLLALLVVGMGFGSVAAELRAASGWLALLLAGIAVPLGWATLHTIFAMHYAHRFYAPNVADEPNEPGEQVDESGLSFPDGRGEPGIWDFVYFAFVIGMTAQTADIGITETTMRRTVLAHSVISFFYNTVILALAVNVGAGLGQ